MTEQMKRGASLDLDGTMSHRQIADALDAMVFTAARDWQRTVRMDESVRELIVTTLRLAYGGNSTESVCEVQRQHRADGEQSPKQEG